MTTKEKTVRRLNRAFGFDFPLDCPCFHHGGRGLSAGCWSWGVSNGNHDVGSCESMTKCLKWKRWVYDPDMNEIFEYVPARAEEYEKYPELQIEKIFE